MTAGRFVRFPLALAVVVMGGAWPASSLAQATGGPYTLRERVISAVGARLAAAPFSATVTAGQPAAGAVAAGRFRLVGGFHRPALLPVPVFRDGFEPAPVTASTRSPLLSSQGTAP